MSIRPLALIGGLLCLCTSAYAESGSKLSLTLASAGEITISVNPSLHEEFGLSYPVTYQIRIPAATGPLTVFRKYHTTDTWLPLPEKTAEDFFNGVEVVRFDYPTRASYVSVAFDSSSHDTFLRFEDASGQPVPIQFEKICRYYDNRTAVVTFTADDWKEHTNMAFLHAVRTLRSFQIPVTTAVITGGCTQNTWQAIQRELDSGYVEAASHTRNHVELPYPDAESEITGSKGDILANLFLPPHFRKGSRAYVYTFIPPYGARDTQMEIVAGRARYLVDRLTSKDVNDLSPWYAAQNRYTPVGISLELGPLYGGITNLAQLNSKFDAALADGKIYHVLIHPYVLAGTDEWSKPYVSGHLTHISRRKNVWYVNFGTIYVYHLLQDDATGQLKVVSDAPVITTQPKGVTTRVGQTATFSLSAVGSAPLAYQWQRSGVDIPGAIDYAYTTPSLTLADSGAAYRCVVSNSIGSTSSSDAIALVTANTVSNGGFEAGTSGWTFFSNGSAAYTTCLAGSPAGAQSMRVTVSVQGSNVQLYQTGIVLQSATTYRLSFNAYSSSGHDLDISVQKHATPYTNYGLSGRKFDLTTSWKDFSVTFTTAGFSGMVADARLMFWLAPYDAAGDRYYIDNVVLSRAADPAPTPPVIAAHPANQTVQLGQKATFTITVSGSTPLAYQWERDNAVISGATGPAYTTSAAAASDSGACFRCVVSNNLGSVTSAAALLIVQSAPPKPPSVLKNGTFENGTTGWVLYSNGRASYAPTIPGAGGSGQAIAISIVAEGTNVQLYQSGVTLQANTNYTLSFDAYSSTGHDLDVSVLQHGAPYTNYGLSRRLFDLSTNWQTFTASFTTRGFTGSVSDGRLYFWLAPYDAPGDKFYFDNITLAPTTLSKTAAFAESAEEAGPEIPNEFVLEGNYPNPFNPSTTIRYGLPEAASVSIGVYSILGQEVAQLAEGPQAPGLYSTTWNGRGDDGATVGSGVYFCRMAATGSSGKPYVATIRLLLVK